MFFFFTCDDIYSENPKLRNDERIKKYLHVLRNLFFLIHLHVLCDVLEECKKIQIRLQHRKLLPFDCIDITNDGIQKVKILSESPLLGKKIKKLDF